MNIDKVLRYIIYIGIGVIILIVPFLITGSMFFPFITGKNIVFRIAVEVITGAWILLALRDVAYRIKKSWILWGLLSLIVVAGLANLFGVEQVKSFWSNFERMDGYVTLLHLAAFVLVTASTIQTRKLWNTLLNTSVVASLAMVMYGLLQLVGTLSSTGLGGGRIAGTFGNATYLAVYMLFNVFLTLLLLVRHTGGNAVKWLYGGAIVLQLFILMQTATRGAMLGVFGGLILTTLLVALFEREQQSYRRFARIGFIVLIVFGGLFFAARNTSLVQGVEPLKRLASISLDEGTAQSRLILWGSTAWNGFKERPLLGWGQEGFGVVFAKYYDPRMLEHEPWFDRAHNIIFDWLIAGGVLGLVAYLSLFVAMVYYIWRPKSSMGVGEKSVITGLLAGYFFHNLFVFDNVVSYIFFGTVLAYVHSRSVYGEDMPNERITERHVVGTPLQYVAFILVPIIVALSMYTFAVKPSLAARALLSGLRQQPTLLDNLALYNKALSYGPLGGKEVELQLFQMAGNIAANPGLEDEIKQAFVSRAIEVGREQSELTDNSTRHELFFGVFLMRLGLFEDALPHLTRALELSPNKQQVLSTLAQYYFSVGNAEKGLSLLKHAYEVAPQFEQSAIAYASSLIQTGNVSVAEEILTTTFDTAIVPHSDIINSYVAVGNLEKVRDLWMERVKNNPEDASAHLSLAGILAELGNVVSAISHVEEAAQIDPSLEEQINEFMVQLGIERTLE